MSHWTQAEGGEPEWSAVGLMGRLQQKQLNLPSTSPGRGEQEKGLWWGRFREAGCVPGPTCRIQTCVSPCSPPTAHPSCVQQYLVILLILLLYRLYKGEY